MEKWKVIGFKKVSFKDKEGIFVNGYSLFVAREPLANSNIVGLEAMKIFINSQYVDYNPVEGQMVYINYNRYGRIESISPEV